MNKRSTAVKLFLAGLIGIVSIIPVIPEILLIQPKPLPVSIEMLQLVSVLQSVLLLALMVWVGDRYSVKVGLGAPLFGRNSSKLGAVLIPATVGGVLGGVALLALFSIFESRLPLDYLHANKQLSLPWYTRILYGGITEEILLRWGLMSFLVWACYRLTQNADSRIRNHNYIVAILLSALLFAVGHIPLAVTLSPGFELPLIAYVMFANMVFGLIAGFLYWKHGLECAIAAHMIAHLLMMSAGV